MDPLPPLDSGPVAVLDSHRPLAWTVVTTSAETSLVNALRDGDEGAFAALVDRYHGPLKRLAQSMGATESVAEEIVQETWLGALQGIDRFEERSSIKTWLFTILKNKARTRAVREKRSVPFSALGPATADDEGGPVVDAARFQGEDGCWPGHWATPPRPWQEPHRRLASMEARARLREAMSSLPPRQQAVVALRDVEGLTSDEVCDLLELTEANQRVLLHRGRSAIRNELEEYVDG
jgi:RNA polymerase sigma-70 factor (ECF subfamily)